MIEVKFYDTVEDSLLDFAVIIAKANGQWVLCKHKDRDTYEVPGGHREIGETFGMLYTADIFSFGEICSEMEKIILCDELIDNWTYPLIQPKLIEEAKRRGSL